MSMTIMCVPCGFKIKKKVDTEYFVNKCMQNDSEYFLVINDDLAIYLRKEKDGNVSVAEKRWDIWNPFNPILEVANTNNNCKETVQDYIWKYRKYINAKWFND